jgi:hypothetical protein
MNICPETTSHPVDTSADLVIAHKLNRAGWAEQAEIHKAGCAHTARKSYEIFGAFTGTLADDWFEVAPCARARKTKTTST